MDRRCFLQGTGALATMALAAILDSCIRRSNQGTKTMADFDSIELGDHSANACTPDIPEDFVGIRIAAPDKVRAGENSFAICGTYRFPAEYVGSFESIHGAIVLVAVDADRHVPFTCSIAIPSGMPPRTVQPPVDPDWMADHFIRRYMNVDLLRFMEDLPRRTARYYVYALIEDNVSNVVTVAYEA